MAARRLIILMVVLLVLSTLAAALVPTEDNSGQQRATGSTATEPRSQLPPRLAPGLPPGGAIRTARLDTASKPPQTITARVGDQLTLLISSRFGALVEVGGFGLFKAVSPAAPARFELLLDRAGVFPVRTLQPTGLAGHICVRLRSRAPRGRSKAEACAPRGRARHRERGRSARQP
jgi:hypothetical protein